MKENYPDDNTVLTGTACPVFPAIYEDENYRFGRRLPFLLTILRAFSKRSDQKKSSTERRRKACE